MEIIGPETQGQVARARIQCVAGQHCRHGPQRIASPYAAIAPAAGWRHAWAGHHVGAGGTAGKAVVRLVTRGETPQRRAGASLAGIDKLVRPKALYAPTIQPSSASNKGKP